MDLLLRLTAMTPAGLEPAASGLGKPCHALTLDDGAEDTGKFRGLLYTLTSTSSVQYVSLSQG